MAKQERPQHKDANKQAPARDASERRPSTSKKQERTEVRK
jgi:hypothetical protein